MSNFKYLADRCLALCMHLYRIGMEQKTTKIIAGILLIAGALLLFRNCTTSDPIDLQNPKNNVQPKRLGSAFRQWENIKTTSDLEFKTGKAVKPTTLSPDMIALAKVQKKYEESLKKKEEAEKNQKKIANKNTKKKKKVAKKNNRPTQSIASQETKKENVADATEAFGGAGGMGIPPRTEVNASPESQAKGYSYWRNLVFSNPSTLTSEMLLAAYLQNQIPAEWFYNIVSEMLQSTNGILQESSINLLAMTPSTTSFRKLSHVIAGRNPQPNLRGLANTSMNDVYKNISYLSILSSELQSNDSTSAYLAAKMILVSAQNNMSTTSFTRQISSSASAYKDLLPILLRVREAAGDGTRLHYYANLAYTYISQNGQTNRKLRYASEDFRYQRN